MRTVASAVAMLRTAPAILFFHAPLLVAVTGAGIAIPFATGRFIDALVARENAVREFATLAILAVATFAVSRFLQWFIMRLARDVELKLQSRVLDAVMDFPPCELAEAAGGGFVAKLTRDVFAASSFVSRLYPQLLGGVVTMCGAAVALYSRSPVLSIAFAAFIPLAIVLFYPFARRFSENSRRVRLAGDKSYIALFDFFRTLGFMRILDAERRFAGRPREALRTLNSSSRATDSLAAVFGVVLGGILVVGEMAVLGVAGVFAAQGRIPVGDVIVYQMLFITAVSSVNGIVSLLPEAAAMREGMDSLAEVLAQPPERKGGLKIKTIDAIEFRNVTFAYPGGKEILRNFSAVFRAGRATALAGVNGSGKTTLLKLAVGALKPASGEVLVNGTRLEDVDQGFFRRAIGVVFQDSLLVSASIRDNITMRDPSFGRSDIERAAEESTLREVLEKFPGALDTRLGIDGQFLSGGECQRLAIARAIVRNPSLVVLDEATNHLDADARAAFGRLLRRLVPGRIVLVVSHDEGIVNLCDEKIFCQIPR